ncbi:hypothetical protein SNE40_001304 [Patella caerulea]|uniref:Uncharacterized protein n=1 Tax=Patella caerulea TaxID=87958 RepID=A0AAN8KND8_PATCE
MVTLKRQIGLAGCISYVAGTIIGSGIFISPSSVLIGCGYSVGVTLMMWALCGFLAMCGAICYMELGSRVRKSGGNYTYIKEGFGDVAGFLFLWVSLFTRPMSTALGCMASAEYIMRAIFMCSDGVPSSAKTILTIVILALITCGNCYSVKLGAYYQTISTVCKVTVLVVIIGTGFTHLAQGQTENFQNPFVTTDITMLGLTNAFYAAFFAYGGWDVLAFGAEEIQNAKRNLPLSILIGVLIPTIVYVTTNVAYHAVLTTEEISSGIAIALVFSKRKLGFFEWVILPIIGLFAAVSGNTNIFMASRMNFVAGRDNLFPRFLSMISITRRTPLVSILVLFITSVIVILIGDIRSVLTTYTFFKITWSIFSVASLKWIRQKYPGTTDTFQTVLFCPIVYVGVSTIVGISFLILDKTVFLSTVTILGTGTLIYYSSRTSMVRFPPFTTINNVIVKLSHRLLLCDFSTKVDYGE